MDYSTQIMIVCGAVAVAFILPVVATLAYCFFTNKF
jgi:hypothetical protein